MAAMRLLIAAIVCRLRNELVAAGQALRLVSTTEGWAVVGGAGGVVRVVGVVGVVVAAATRGATQGGLVAGLAVVDLALVFEAGEAGLDVVELGGCDHVVGTRGQDGCDLFFRVHDAIGSLGMV